MRLIDADELVREITEAQNSLLSDNDAVWELNQKYYKGLAWAHRLALDAPTVDAVPVVRCKDCQYLFDKSGELSCCCHSGLLLIYEDSYCSHGVRRRK